MMTGARKFSKPSVCDGVPMKVCPNPWHTDFVCRRRALRDIIGRVDLEAVVTSNLSV